jgi:hypothetical protein
LAALIHLPPTSYHVRQQTFGRTPSLPPLPGREPTLVRPHGLLSLSLIARSQELDESQRDQAHRQYLLQDAAFSQNTHWRGNTLLHPSVKDGRRGTELSNMEIHTVSIFGLHTTAYKLPGMLRQGCKLSKSFNQLLCAVLLEPLLTYGSDVLVIRGMWRISQRVSNFHVPAHIRISSVPRPLPTLFLLEHKGKSDTLRL